MEASRLQHEERAEEVGEHAGQRSDLQPRRRGPSAPAARHDRDPIGTLLGSYRDPIGILSGSHRPPLPRPPRSPAPQDM